MVNFDEVIVETLRGNIRVNETLKTVEIYDEFGVKLVLRNLTETQYEAFAANYPHY